MINLSSITTIKKNFLAASVILNYSQKILTETQSLIDGCSKQFPQKWWLALFFRPFQGQNCSSSIEMGFQNLFNSNIVESAIIFPFHYDNADIKAGKKFVNRQHTYRIQM